MKIFDAQKIRSDFPLLSQKVRGQNLIYLDSAATTLKPWPVIEKLSHFYSYQTANVHRGAHYLSDQATAEYEGSRDKIQKFLKAAFREEIIFTKGTTESLNLVASSFGDYLIKEGDLILLTEMEHHSNIVPWQLLAERKKAKLEVIPVNSSGQLDRESLNRWLTQKPKILAMTHCSNVLGTINPVKEFADQIHSVGGYIVVDGAQMVLSHAVDVQNLNCDFYAFSGHKLFGPYGVGVLFGKKEILAKMPPYQGGGSMIETVSFEKTTFQDPPYRFEAGTPAIPEAIALGHAIDYLQSYSFLEIQTHLKALVTLATAGLTEIPGIQFYGPKENQSAILSFSIGKIHGSDIAQILDQNNVAVRAGHLCAQPLMRKLGVSHFLRASFSIYNNSNDVEKLVQNVKLAQEMLK